MTNKDKPQKSSETLNLSSNELAAMLASMGTMPGNKEYQIMAKLCSQRTASGYEHAFRAIKAKAREFRNAIELGQVKGLEDVVGKARGGGGGGQGKGVKKESKAKAKRKRGDSMVDGEDDGEEGESLTKKVRVDRDDDEKLFQ